MATTHHPLRIFVVENDADTLKYFQLFLEGLGHAVFVAGTLAEALVKIPLCACDVLISDVGLEDGTGWELLRRLRAETPDAPPYAIAVSGFGRNSDRSRSELAGYRHHLLKPFDFQQLEAMLAEAGGERA